VPSDHAPFPAAARAPSHLLAEKVYAVGHDLVGLALIDLVRSGLIFQVLEHVSQHGCPYRTDCQWQVEFNSATIDLALIELVLRQKEHSERVQSHIAERQLVALVVLPETTGATGTGGEMYVFLGDVGHVGMSSKKIY
jgi:hypothetical protein